MAGTHSHPDLSAQAGRVRRAGLRWILAGLVAVVLAFALLALTSHRQRSLSQAQAAQAVLVAHLATAPSRVVRDPAALLSDLRTAQSQLTSLGQPVPPALSSSVKSTSDQAQALVQDAAALRDAATAFDGLPALLERVSVATAAIRKQPRLLQGRWGQALASPLAELTRPELASMPAVFAANAANAQLQSQWSARFGQVSSALDRLPAIAQRDNTLDAASRQALSEWVESAKVLTATTTALSEALPLRVSAAKAANTLLAAGSPALPVAAPTPMLWRALEWAGWALALLALTCWGMVLRQIMQARTLAQEVSEESRQSTRQVDAVERLMRQIQKVVPPDGPVQPAAHVEEAPGSPFFPVATAVNRLSDALLVQHRRTSTQSNEIDHAIAPLGEGLHELVGVQQQLKTGSQELLQSSQQAARQSAGTAERLGQMSQQLRSIQEGIGRAVSMLQERGFRMDALRESNQEIAKRIKRLGESSQGIGLAADRTNTISQQLKVVAINIAIEAASAGPAGQPFASMAQEVQRLSAANAEQAQELYGLIELLLGDAAVVASTMEAATVEVVESGRLSEQTEGAVRDIERVSQPLAAELARLVEDLETQALALAEGVRQQEQAQVSSGHGQALAGRLQEGLSVVRQKVRSLDRNE